MPHRTDATGTAMRPGPAPVTWDVNDANPATVADATEMDADAVIGRYPDADTVALSTDSEPDAVILRYPTPETVALSTDIVPAAVTAPGAYVAAADMVASATVMFADPAMPDETTVADPDTAAESAVIVADPVMPAETAPDPSRASERRPPTVAAVDGAVAHGRNGMDIRAAAPRLLSVSSAMVTGRLRFRRPWWSCHRRLRMTSDQPWSRHLRTRRTRWPSASSCS